MLPRLCWRAALGLLPLLLAPFAHAAPTEIPSAASFYVPTLPDLHQDPNRPLRIYAGHLPADPNAATTPATTLTAHLYFVLIKARKLADKERVLFWFNGGPGCSSFDGLMMEVGPWRMHEDGQLYVEEGGWEEYTNIVYVDQPVGTGFSYASTDRYVHELSDAASELIEFMRNFYKVFPEYQGMDTYLGGESFAGQYIPYFTDAILDSTLGVPLKGSMIGNGWIDAMHQYPAYLQYAVKHGLVEEGSKQYQTGKKATDECMAILESGSPSHVPVHVDICEQLLGKVSGMGEGRTTGKCLNMYDVRLQDSYPECGMNWPPPLHNITAYLRRKEVVAALHAESKAEAWTECNGPVHTALTMRRSNSSVTVLPRVLARVPVLIFAGDQDLICNYVGLENMIQGLTWNGATGLGTVETQTWSVDGKAAGTWVSARNLTYVKIFNASHMVGFDAPIVSHDMLLRFIGANLTALADGAARIPSSLGSNSRPLLGEAASDRTAEKGASGAPATTPEQDKARWEAYYNAGSAALVLVLVILAVGTFFWCRVRRRRSAGVALSQRAGEEEEAIPLTRSNPDFSRSQVDLHGNGNGYDNLQPRSLGKGKGRALRSPSPSPAEQLFDVGDSEDEEEKSR
ncbi:unnamed protein product [Peniophora sp. CBMAI 1063]|nr:unnamed protein product [Peniophora sp. CBMAI 1063]